jgi:hypothetical protein
MKRRQVSHKFDYRISKFTRRIFRTARKCAPNNRVWPRLFIPVWPPSVFCTRVFLQKETLSMFLSRCRLTLFLRLYDLPLSDGLFRNSLRNAICDLRSGKLSLLACVCHLPEYFVHFLSPSCWYSLQLNPVMFSKT